MHAPSFRWSLPMEQVRPLLRIGDVLTMRISVAPEIVRDFDIQCAVGIREPLEFDIEILPDDAACTFCADDVAAADVFLLAGLVFDQGCDAVRVLGEAGKRRSHSYFDHGIGLGHLEPFVHDLDSFALQHERKFRVVFENGMIEFRNPLALGSVPVMKQRRDDSARLQLLVKIDLVVHLQSCRMIGARARYLVEEIRVGQLLDDVTTHTILCKLECETQTHGTGADNQYTVGRRRHTLPDVFSGITSFTAPVQPLWVKSKTMTSGSSYLHS